MVLPWSGKAQVTDVSFEALEKLRIDDAKTTIVFIHTDWCKYCLKMENTTFMDEEVVTLINKHFYFTKLNAEGKDPIHFLGHTFKFKPTGASSGIHELATELGTIDGKINYPTISIINAKNEIVFQYGGFMETAELVAVLKALIK